MVVVVDGLVSREVNVMVKMVMGTGNGNDGDGDYSKGALGFRR